MKELLVATTNPAKLAEYRLLTRSFDLKIVSLRDACIMQEAPEDAESFAANARSKAHFYFDLSGIPTLADDGGLAVDALGGAPGVRSHRWLGVENAGDRMLAEEVIRRMEGVAPARRTARLCAAAALLWREAGSIHEVVAEAALEGIIAERCYHEIRPGFPYRSVLWLPDHNCYQAELSDEAAAQVSQRRVAIAKLTFELNRLASLP